MQWNLIRLRKERGITQKQLADYLGINITTYVRKENGESPFKDWEMFKIRDFFGKETLDEIFLPRNCITNAIKEVHNAKN